MWLLQATYDDGTSEKYLLSVCFIPGKVPDAQMQPPVLCRIQVGIANGWLCDAVWCDDFRMSIFRLFAAQARIGDDNQQVTFTTSPMFMRLSRDQQTSRVLNAEQSNTSIVIGNTLFLKLYRKVEMGVNPDIELSKFLSEEARFPDIPAWIGDIQWNTSAGPIGVGILQQLLPGSTVGWSYFLSKVKPAMRNFEAGSFRDKIEQLGKLTAGMHLALSSRDDHSEFRTEPFEYHQQQEFITKLMSDVDDTFALLRNSIDKLSHDARESSMQLLEMEVELHHMLADIDLGGIHATLMRVHGDYHLGQILVFGDSFRVTDFEGEPGRSYEDRRTKQPAMKDIAGMIRSFQYLVYGSVLLDEADKSVDKLNRQMPQVSNLYHDMTEVYLQSYTGAMANSNLVPPVANDFRTLLRLYLLDKALYELRYELNNRPDWVIIPVTGLISTIQEWMESGVQHA